MKNRKSNLTTEELEKILSNHKDKVFHEEDRSQNTKNLDEKVDHLLALTELSRKRLSQNQSTPKTSWKRNYALAASFLIGFMIQFVYQDIKTNTAPTKHDGTPIPHTYILSQSPNFVQPSHDGDETVLRISSSPIHKTIKSKKKKISWLETGLSPLDRGQAIIVTFGNKNNIKAKIRHKIYVLDPQKALQIQKQIKDLDCPMKKAKILFNNHCFAEALNYALKYHCNDPNSLECLQLLENCYKRLGYKKDYDEIREKIKELKSPN